MTGEGHLQGELNEALDSIRMTESRPRDTSNSSVSIRDYNHSNDVKKVMIERASSAIINLLHNNKYIVKNKRKY